MKMANVCDWKKRSPRSVKNERALQKYIPAISAATTQSPILRASGRDRFIAKTKGVPT